MKIDLTAFKANPSTVARSGPPRRPHFTPTRPTFRRDPTLLAHFARFWPRGASAPPGHEWLASLVDRAGAYYWISAFPERVLSISPDNRGQIDLFVAESLAASNPAIAQEKKKRCKKDGGRPVLPEGDDCWDVKKICADTHQPENPDAPPIIIQKRIVTQRCCFSDDGEVECRPEDPCNTHGVIV